MSDLDRLGRDHAERVRSSVSGVVPPTIDEPIVVSAPVRNTKRSVAVGAGLAVVAALVVPQILLGPSGDPGSSTLLFPRTCGGRIYQTAGLVAGASGFSTPEIAAQRVRRAVVESGGHPQGGPVAELVRSGDLSFRIPYPVAGVSEGSTDIVITVSSLAPLGTGYLVTGVEVCEDSVSDAFWHWPPPQTVTCEFRTIGHMDHFGEATDGHATREAAAEEFRQAVIDSGGHPDGQSVAALVRGPGEFRIPYSVPGKDEADFIIRVERGGPGGYVVSFLEFCSDAVFPDFSWGGVEK